MSEEIILHYPPRGQPTRVFRPWEFRALVRAIPKNEYKDKIEALLFAGCRYAELCWLFQNPRMYKDTHIQMRNKKAMVREKYRWVKLNTQGQRAIENFLRSKKNLPTHQTWSENLERWCKYAGIDSTGVCAKSTRKTWESWLMITYQNRMIEILLSQGHGMTTALTHYLSFPFSDKDKTDMRYYVEGW